MEPLDLFSPLPFEILCRVCEHLDRTDVLSLSSCSRALRILCTRNEIFRPDSDAMLWVIAQDIFCYDDANRIYNHEKSRMETYFDWLLRARGASRRADDMHKVLSYYSNAPLHRPVVVRCHVFAVYCVWMEWLWGAKCSACGDAGLALASCSEQWWRYDPLAWLQWYEGCSLPVRCCVVSPCIVGYLCEHCRGRWRGNVFRGCAKMLCRCLSATAVSALFCAVVLGVAGAGYALLALLELSSAAIVCVMIACALCSFLLASACLLFLYRCGAFEVPPEATSFRHSGFQLAQEEEEPLLLPEHEDVFGFM
eukprot:TRINITY_DN4853_c0_g1_i1.p1 TRINITY_DN4853_c0_g1~~TRINITY_DN4853_c0_g1_i1.p1  ORF type:complete len:309 (+),score=43.93 TRINITY_DN4853_c0_g1_i1:264-1190(+)